MTPSRRLFLAGLFAAPAVIAIGHLMPVKLFKPTPASLFLECRYSPEFAAACASLDLNVENELRKIIPNLSEHDSLFPLRFAEMEVGNQDNTHAEVRLVMEHPEWPGRISRQLYEAEHTPEQVYREVMCSRDLGIGGGRSS